MAMCGMWESNTQLKLEMSALSATTADAPLFGGMLWYYRVATKPGEAALVIQRAVAVLRPVLDAMLSSGWRWSETEGEPPGLPEYFRQRCRPDSVDPETTEEWSLQEWLSWTALEDRQWMWRAARITTEDGFELTVESTGSPFPSDALRWLLRASGALSVEGPM